MCVGERDKKRKRKETKKNVGGNKMRQKMSQNQRNLTGDVKKEENMYAIQILTKVNHHTKTSVY